MRSLLAGILPRPCGAFDAQVLAYSLPPRARYELLLFTRQANLSRLMRHVIGVSTPRTTNADTARVGRSFRGASVRCW